MKKLLVLGLVLLISVILAYSYSNYIKKEIPSPSTEQDSLGLFLKQNSASSEVSEAYRFAKENPQDVLSYVKCYCGCIKNQEHKNNRDCFFNEDGSTDLMGLNCGLCVKTALASKKMLSEGKSVREISDFVDKRWGKI